MNMTSGKKLILGLTLAASLSIPSALADSAVITAEKSANIRSGAGMNHPVIGWAIRGDRLETLGVSGNWTKVEMKNGKEGYIHTSLLNGASAPAQGTKAKIIAETSANLRSEPNGKIIGWAGNGESVVIIEKGSKWSRVQLTSGKTGYIHNSLISSGESQNQPESAVSTVIAEVSANVRSEPNGKIINWALKGSKVTILEKGVKWSKVRLESGNTGYIHNSLLK